MELDRWDIRVRCGGMMLKMIWKVLIWPDRRCQHRWRMQIKETSDQTSLNWKCSSKGLAVSWRACQPGNQTNQDSDESIESWCWYTLSFAFQRIRGFTTMRYINQRFTYLLTYLLNVWIKMQHERKTNRSEWCIVLLPNLFQLFVHLLCIRSWQILWNGANCCRCGKNWNAK